MKRILLFAFGFLCTTFVLAQTKIGGSAATAADPSAVLELSGTNKGFLPPRVALTATNAASPVTSPATGLLVFNTATAGSAPNNVVPGYYYWNGTAWAYLTNNAVNSMGAIAGSSTANGASISNGVLSLAPADGTNGGVLTSGTQTIAGAKTFSGNTTISGNLTGGNSASSAISGFSANLSSQSSSYTLAAADNGKVIQFSAPATLTLPSTLPAGFNCMIVQTGSGQVTFTGSGVTIYNRNSFTKTAGQYSIVTILYLSSSTAITSGEMSN